MWDFKCLSFNVADRWLYFLIVCVQLVDQLKKRAFFRYVEPKMLKEKIEDAKVGLLFAKYYRSHSDVKIMPIIY